MTKHAFVLTALCNAHTITHAHRAQRTTRREQNPTCATLQALATHARIQIL